MQFRTESCNKICLIGWVVNSQKKLWQICKIFHDEGQICRLTLLNKKPPLTKKSRIGDPLYVKKMPLVPMIISTFIIKNKLEISLSSCHSGVNFFMILRIIIRCFKISKLHIFTLKIF